MAGSPHALAQDEEKVPVFRETEGVAPLDEPPIGTWIEAADASAPAGIEACSGRAQDLCGIAAATDPAETGPVDSFVPVDAPASVPEHSAAEARQIAAAYAALSLGLSSSGSALLAPPCVTAPAGMLSKASPRPLALPRKPGQHSVVPAHGTDFLPGWSRSALPISAETFHASYDPQPQVLHPPRQVACHGFD